MEVRETERKYDLDLSQEVPRLEEALGDSIHVERVPPIRLDATYFDTDDHRLLTAGMTLRKRSGGSDEGWHLKVPTGTLGTRIEIREPLGDPRSFEIPTALTDLVFATTRGRGLSPVAKIHTERTTEQVVDESGAILIEVADDLVRARGNFGGPLRTWRELEVEVEPGGERLAEEIHRHLRSQGIYESDERSKLATALQGDDRQDDVQCSPDRGAVFNVIFRGLSAQVEELAIRDLAVRRGEDDAVHDMRVATRRLRSCLRVFAKSLRLGKSEGIQEDLRWIGTVLGEVRDGGVLRGRLEGRAESELSSRDRPVVEQILDSYFSAALAKASSTLDAALQSPRYVRLLDDLDAVIEELSRRDGLELTSKATLNGLQREVERARHRLTEGRNSTGEQRDVFLHKARKAAKRARYAAEMAASLAPKRAQTIAERCEEAQASLGERQDGVIAMALLHKLALSQESEFNLETERRASFALGILEGTERAEISVIDEHLGQIERRLSRLHV